jgi:copper resistance protein C
MLLSVRPVPVVTVLTLLAALLVGTAPSAGAHAILVGSEPASGALLDEVPSKVVLEFNEPVETEFGQLQVSDPEGQRLDQEPPTTEGGTVRAPIAATAVAGEHTIAYRVISADGHPIEGQLTFEVSAAAIEAAEAGAVEADAAETAADTAAEPGDEPADEPAEEATPSQDLVDDVAPVEPDLTAAEDEGGMSLWPFAVVALIVLVAAGVLLARRGEDERPDSTA